MHKKPLDVFCLPRIPGKRWLPMLEWLYGEQETNELFQHIPPEEYRDVFNVVSSIEDASYILVPHTYSRIKSSNSYIASAVNLSLKHKKKILIFAYQDSAEEIMIPHSIVFRPSQYKNQKKKNEIMMPAVVERLSHTYPFIQRHKSDLPSVGFVGKASSNSFVSYLRFLLKNTLLLHPYKDGVYYRQKALRVLTKSSRVVTRTILRSSYSGNKKSITVDPQEARNSYIDNIINTDFTLAPKGDGNYSLRFYETLALGRIPILIDTETILPLENEIPYRDIIMRVGYKDIDRLDDIITSMYASWTEHDFLNRQEKCREVFEQYLYMPQFLKRVCTEEFLSLF